MMRGLALIDEPRSGPFNMAIDDAMARVAAERNLCLLRIYRWQEPTLSLGYFQKLADRETHLSSRDLKVVRRATGGGAIVHHHDWTYSLALPDSIQIRQPTGTTTIKPKGAAEPLYHGIHTAVVRWLEATLQLEANLFPADTKSGAEFDPFAFLCFGRRSAGDVVSQECKILGSAQRRHSHALVQHGSLLLAKSKFAPSLNGLKELCPLRPLTDPVDFSLRLAEGVTAITGVEFSWRDGLDELVYEEICPDHYENPSWTAKR